MDLAEYIHFVTKEKCVLYRNLGKLMATFCNKNKIE